MIERIRGLAALTRRLQYVIDLVILALSFQFAYLLRFDFGVPSDAFAQMAVQLPLVLTIQVGALAIAGVYSFIWRYVGLREFKAFLLAFV